MNTVLESPSYTIDQTNCRKKTTDKRPPSSFPGLINLNETVGGFKLKIELLWKVYLEILTWLGIDIFQGETQTAYNNSENLYTFCAILNPLFMEFPLKWTSKTVRDDQTSFWS